MNGEEQKDQDDKMGDDKMEGMEYEYDDQAEQIQGRLATDQIEEQQLKIHDDNKEDAE